MLGEFLIKDVVLLRVSLWTLADSLGAHRRTRPASPDTCAWIMCAAGSVVRFQERLAGRVRGQRPS